MPICRDFVPPCAAFMHARMQATRACVYVIRVRRVDGHVTRRVIPLRIATGVGVIAACASRNTSERSYAWGEAVSRKPCVQAKLDKTAGSSHSVPRRSAVSPSSSPSRAAPESPVCTVCSVTGKWRESPLRSEGEAPGLQASADRERSPESEPGVSAPNGVRDEPADGGGGRTSRYHGSCPA